jgi:hypothetical protein
MRLVPTFIRLGMVILISGAATAPAHAFDLTGHWVGKYSCKNFHGTKDASINKNSTLAITQTGNTFAANIDAANAGHNFRYNGLAVPDAKSPDTKGEAVLLGCHLANTLASHGATLDGELQRASVKTKGGTFKATFKSTSFFQDTLPEVGACKYTFKRTDTTDPGVTACP